MLTIRFQNQQWLFTGDSLDDGGAICTVEAFNRGECSYAHLGTDGLIRRFQKEIGTIQDIEVLGPYQEILQPGQPNVASQMDRLRNILSHLSWEKR